MPLVMTLLMVIVQAALYFHTQAVATTAARKATNVARVAHGSPAAAEAASREFMSQSGQSLLDASVEVERRGAMVEATVSGRVVSVLWGVPLRVRVVVRAPVEETTP